MDIFAYTNTAILSCVKTLKKSLNKQASQNSFIDLNIIFVLI